MNCKKLKILAVDDDPIALAIIEELLTSHYQCEVVAANSAEEALDKTYQLELSWQPRWYDLILMDINMPVLKGNVVTKIIKQSEKSLRNIPVVAVTSADTAKRKDEFVEKFGIADVIVKPVTFKKLDRVIRKYLPIKGKII